MQKRNYRRKKRGRGAARSRRALCGWLIGLLLLACMGLLPEWAGTSGPGGAGLQTEMSSQAETALELHFIDVGHGDATLLLCDGASMLIDAGDDNHGTAIQNYLKKHQVEQLDYLILTHPDKDHIGGAPVIISKFKIDKVFLSGYEKDSSAYRKLMQALDDKRLRAETPEVGARYTFGSAEFTILAPNDVYEESNNSSVALLIQHGENRFLFTGDAEKKAEGDMIKNGIDMEADVYQAGHHGSKSSSGEKLLDAVMPEYAVISCAPDDPRAEVLNRFRERGIKVFRTDEQGSIVAVSNGSGISFRCAPSDTWQAAEPQGSAKEKE